MGDNHRAQFTRWQHIGEHLASERQRLEAELRYVVTQAQRLDADVTAFLQQAYGLDAQHIPVTLDSERGMLVTPDTLTVSTTTTTTATTAPQDEPAEEEPHND